MAYVNPIAENAGGVKWSSCLAPVVHIMEVGIIFKHDSIQVIKSGISLELIWLAQSLHLCSSLRKIVPGYERERELESGTYHTDAFQ